MSSNRPRAAVVVALVLVVAGVATAAMLSVEQGTTFDAEDGPAVTLGQDRSISDSNPFPTSGSVKIGETTISGPAGSSATLSGADSASPELSSIETNGGELQADSTGIQKIGVTGSVSRVEYRDVDLSERQTTELSVDGSGDVIVYGGFSVGVEAVYATQENKVLEPNGQGAVLVPVESGAEVTLVESDAPTKSNPSPTGGTAVQDAELAVDVEDPDFSDADDSVRLEWYVDGGLDGTTSVSSNGTATFDSSASAGGGHEWYVVATDDSGRSDRSPGSGSHAFRLPDEFEIRNESAPKELVTGSSVEVEVRFYQRDSENVFERTTTDGTVSFEGLPTQEEFIVSVSADGFADRRTYVESLTTQQEVYLLPESVSSVFNRFVLEDLSGNYQSSQTRLEIKRALNTTEDPETLEYKAVSGDYFGGVNEHKATLAQDRRHRLVISNRDGDRRVIGSYQAIDEANPKVIQVDEVVVDPPQGRTFYGTAYTEDPNQTDDTERVRFTYSDPTGDTDKLRYRIVSENDSTVLVDETIDDPGTNLSYSEQIPNGENYRINWSAERNGETIGPKTYVIGSRAQTPLPVDQVWLNRFVLVLLPVFAALASERIATYGAIGLVVLTGLLMVLGWYSVNPALWMAGLVIAVGGHLLQVTTRQGAYG
jgi:hypothetical protein